MDRPLPARGVPLWKQARAKQSSPVRSDLCSTVSLVSLVGGGFVLLGAHARRLWDPQIWASLAAGVAGLGCCCIIACLLGAQ